ncbi:MULTISPECIES: major capsid protein [Nitrosomonas]|uniref:Phage capsid protein n=2 Tax=Nitrosomonas communis TaxID=44574 RepID=A0A5D3YAT6_9PROT|nr:MULTISPECIES: major capsid protein [Nitrosomonas]TYP84730.1 hypothetical protein BCL69_103840 [Nitrosomonas communis]UVS62507.1 major capsid protein [Nitrosomonas sp. PLL12]
MFKLFNIRWIIALMVALVFSTTVLADYVPADMSLGIAAIGAIRPFPIDPKLTAIAIAYRNPDIALIADEVLPRTPVAQEFKYLKYDLAQGFTVPDTRVGRKSTPNEVDFNATEITDKVIDYGLDDLVPNEDIEADNQGVNPLGTATMYLTNLVNLARELRAASLVFNTNSYAAGNQTTLSGTSQWSDAANSDPVAVISDALDIPVIRPNIGILGQATWTKLRRHPKIVQAIKNTDQGAGMVSRQEFADFFELQALYVGAGFANSAKKGQTASLARVWGKHASFIYRDRAAGPQAGVTFGFTGEWGNKIAGNIDEPKVGLTGSQRVRVGERVKELICATDLGYFFQNAVN